TRRLLRARAASRPRGSAGPRISRGCDAAEAASRCASPRPRPFAAFLASPPRKPPSLGLLGKQTSAENPLNPRWRASTSGLLSSAPMIERLRQLSRDDRLLLLRLVANVAWVDGEVQDQERRFVRRLMNGFD